MTLQSVQNLAVKQSIFGSLFHLSFEHLLMSVGPQQCRPPKNRVDLLN